MAEKNKFTMLSQCPNKHAYYEKNEFILECKECGLGKTRIETAPCNVQNYLLKNEDEIRGRLGYYRQLYHKYFDIIFKQKGRVLDVGCADGLFLELLESQGWEVYGVEPFPKRTHRHIKIKEVCVEDFFSELRFDLIIMASVLEHIKNPLGALVKCRGLLKEEGKIFITLANYGGWWSRICGMNWVWLNLKEHTYHYTVASIRRILFQLGFEIVSLQTSSVNAPSLPNVFLSEKNVFGKGLFNIWPLSPLFFRFTNWIKRPFDMLADYSLKGAEIEIIANRN